MMKTIVMTIKTIVMTIKTIVMTIKTIVMTIKTMVKTIVMTIKTIANVIPIPKIASPEDITKDLRPISLTPTLSKTCEQFVTDWLLEYIKEKIDRRQFGSLKNSTTHALLSFIHHLLYETDTSKTAVRVFLLDFSKAFDLIDHNILLYKLYEMKVPSTITNWIRSFLFERKQRVKIANCVSN